MFGVEIVCFYDYSTFFLIVITLQQKSVDNGKKIQRRVGSTTWSRKDEESGRKGAPIFFSHLFGFLTRRGSETGGLSLPTSFRRKQGEVEAFTSFRHERRRG